ncbi:MAG: Peptidoglycan hydrolase FlgJ [Syntrophomonadaceae bacterium]|nr:Peptidoglycan hydrolase FlgJ [Bacillota bacterium]
MASRKEIIDQLTPIVQRLAQRHSWIVGKKSMVLAQIIIESNWLKSAPQNNVLGIKWTSRYPESRRQMLRTKEWVNGRYVSVKAPFMTYESIEQCIEEGYVAVLSRPRYKDTRASRDWFEATNYIRLDGYATSPSYTKILRNIILRHKLYELDWQKNPEEPISEKAPNFQWRESYSGIQVDGKRYPRIIEPYPELWHNVMRVAEEIQILRDYYRSPIRAESWFRIAHYNAVIGGASRSQHLAANAIDARPLFKINMGEFHRKAEELTKFRGFGIGKTLIHMDLRKIPARWIY